MVLIVIDIYMALVITFLEQLKLIKLHYVMFIYFLNQILLFATHGEVLLLAQLIVFLNHSD